VSWHHHQRGVVCPLCAKEVKPIGSRYQEAIMFGGRPVPEDVAEAQLAYDPDAEMDKYFDSDEFEQRALDAIERNAALAAVGNLAPVSVPDDQNSRKVLAEQAAKIEGATHA
jgi:predicted RNA-binding Zn ribbon-like protein